MNMIKTLMQDERIVVRISDYQISGEPERLREILDMRGIKNYYYRFVSGQGAWHDCGGVDIQPVDDQQKYRHFKTCSFKGCLTLENGELTYCSRATNAYRLQGFERGEGDYLPVIDGKDFSPKLKSFINHRKAMEACRYCNGTEAGELIAPARQP